MRANLTNRLRGITKDIAHKRGWSIQEFHLLHVLGASLRSFYTVLVTVVAEGLDVELALFNVMNGINPFAEHSAYPPPPV
jgi:hypothetical protein